MTSPGVQGKPAAPFRAASFFGLAGWLGSRAALLGFEFRANGLRLARGIRNLSERPYMVRILSHPVVAQQDVLAESRTDLWNSSNPAEWLLTAGKVENLRRAARSLHGLLVNEGETFSFWRAIGRPTRARGFVKGRELREGCMVASVGGGLCQLSNALYAAALEAGQAIVERHAHSRIVPGSQAAAGRDATVFWNYVDLRFRATIPLRIEVVLTSSELIVCLRAMKPGAAKTPSISRYPAKLPATWKPGTADDCVTCRQEACVQRIRHAHIQEQSAFLLDAAWPEFARWFSQHSRENDIAMVPLDGARRGRSAYAWPAKCSDLQIIEYPWLTLRRSLATRRLAHQGAVRQQALLRLDAALARAYARHLPYRVDRLVVSLNLLPHLARLGILGGRKVTVLMNRSPLEMLHQQLDRTMTLHPDSVTAADFRAGGELIEYESKALANAESVVTPHRGVARFLEQNFEAHVDLIEWSIPRATPQKAGIGVLFPSSSLARKGAYEIREASFHGRWPLRVLGRASESADFWKGRKMDFADPENPFRDIGCVVLPAYVEHQPRLLLRALAAGLPVICTAECGLAPDFPSLTLIPSGNTQALSAAVAKALDLSSEAQATAGGSNRHTSST